MPNKKTAFVRACRFTALIAIASAAAFAQTISYPNFASTSGLALKGTATIAETNGGTVLRLTKAVCYSAGSAFTASPVPFQIAADTFSTFFQFRITNPGGISPADGIVFVIREAGSADLGSTGGSQGCDGIGQSLGIKFDTYQNEKEATTTLSPFRPTAQLALPQTRVGRPRGRPPRVISSSPVDSGRAFRQTCRDDCLFSGSGF